MSSKKKASKATPEGTSDTRLSRGRTRPGAIFPVAPATASLPPSYAATLQQIKTHLAAARVRAILAANPIVIEAYWQTGKIILARQREAGWGAKVIDRLAADLQAEFPDMSGLTRRNLFSMRAFAAAFPDIAIVKRLVSQLPWGQIIRLIQMVKDPATREFYIRETLAQGWSRDILEIQIKNQLHLCAGKAQNNFHLTMPPADSDMATQLFKDPFLFDFLGTADPRREAEVEQTLVDHIQKFLLELGTGFAFVGRQVRLEVGGEDYPLDLLFYHLKRCPRLVWHRAFGPFGNMTALASSAFAHSYAPTAQRHTSPGHRPGKTCPTHPRVLKGRRISPNRHLAPNLCGVPSERIHRGPIYPGRCPGLVCGRAFGPVRKHPALHHP